MRRVGVWVMVRGYQRDNGLMGRRGLLDCHKADGFLFACILFWSLSSLHLLFSIGLVVRQGIKADIKFLRKGREGEAGSD